MKPSQLIAVLLSIIVLVCLLGWASIRVPQYRAQQKFLKEIEERRQQEAAQAQTEKKPEFYSVNPFVIAPSNDTGPLPKAEIQEDLMFEHGEMILGTTGKHAFILKNVGDAPLKVAKGPMECKCQIPALKNDELAPGESTELIVEFTPTNEGAFIRHNDFWTNDPENQLIRVGVHAEVVGDLTIMPSLGFDLGSQAADKEIPFEGRLFSKQTASFEVTGYESSTPDITFEWSVDPRDEQLGATFTHGFRLKGKFKTGQKPRVFKESVTFFTTFPGKESITFPVIGSVRGALTILGPYWDSVNMRFKLGDVRTDKEQRFRMTALITPGPEELKFLDVKSVPEFVKLELRREGSVGDKERYVLEVIVPAGAPEGIWMGPTAGQILVHTNHPDMDMLRFQLSLTTFSGR